jgi:hypothetical protein
MTRKELFVLAFHSIVDTPAASTEYSTTNFNTIIDFIATNGYSVRTKGDVFARGL